MRETTFEMEPLCCVESCLVREACFITIGTHMALLMAVCVCVTLNIHMAGAVRPQYADGSPRRRVADGDALAAAVGALVGARPALRALARRGRRQHVAHARPAALRGALLAHVQTLPGTAAAARHRDGVQVFALVVQLTMLALLVAAMAVHTHKMTAVNVVFAVLLGCDALLLVWQVYATSSGRSTLQIPVVAETTKYFGMCKVLVDG